MSNVVRPMPILGVIYAIAALLAYGHTVAWIGTFWFKDEGIYVHGPILAIMVCYLLWQNRAEWLGLPQSASKLWWGATSASALVWLVAWAAEMYPLQVLAFFGVMWCGLCGLMGRGALVPFGLRFGLLAFSMPIWFNVMPVLQAVATFGTETILSLFGLVIYVEDVYVQTAVGTFEIAGGCAGLGLFLVSMSLAGYLTFSYRVSVRQALVLFAIAAFIGILANWIRISIVISAGYFYGIDHPLVGDHANLGWIVYAVVGAPFVLLAGRYLKENPAPAHGGPTTAEANYVFTTIVFALMLIPPAVTMLDRTATVPELAAPGWQDIGPSGDWSPSMDAMDQGAREAYVGEDGGIVDAFALPLQTPIANMNALGEALAGEDWFRLADGREVTDAYIEIELRDHYSERRRVLRYWVQAGDATIARDRERRRTLTLARLRGHRQPYLVGESAACADASCVAARTRLDALRTARSS